jgi:hypothetical protein
MCAKTALRQDASLLERSMQKDGDSISIKLSDAWPPELAGAIGLINIAFAQLQREVYLGAKRKADIPLIEWERANRSDNFTQWSRHLIDQYPKDLKLRNLIERAQCSAERRHDLIHASCGRHDGALGRWRRGQNLGIELEPLEDLLTTIREIRDQINRHTKGLKTPKEKAPPERA